MMGGSEYKLQVPNELCNIPEVLPRYVGNISEYSLCSIYGIYLLLTSGPHKNQVTANLHVHFGVVLHQPYTESAKEASSDDEKDGEASGVEEEEEPKE
jgi:hypothetical protein